MYREFVMDAAIMFQLYWTVNSPMQSTIIHLVEQVVGALGTEFKVFLPQIVPQMLRVFMHDTSAGRGVTAKVSVRYRCLRVGLVCYHALPCMYLL